MPEMAFDNKTSQCHARQIASVLIGNLSRTSVTQKYQQGESIHEIFASG